MTVQHLDQKGERSVNGTAASGGDATTDLAWLLRGALGAHRAAIAQALAKAGHESLPPLALWAIDALAGGERSAGELATRLGVSKQTISQLVELLAARGYLERAPDEHDRRRVTLRLTRQGRAAGLTIARVCENLEARAREELGDGALQQARMALAALGAPGPS
jgi:DNA-binding MarR family transcriptional regulator